MSVRANRVGEQMKKELGEIIGRKIKGPTYWFCDCNRCTSYRRPAASNGIYFGVRR